jgi:hypothetical protein
VKGKADIEKTLKERVAALGPQFSLTEVSSIAL